MDALAVEGEREIGASLGDTRLGIVRFLRAQEFTITNEQVSAISAKRGSQLIGPAIPKKLPLRFDATLSSTRGGVSLVTFRFANAWKASKVVNVEGPYRSALAELASAFDRALTAIGGDAPGTAPADQRDDEAAPPGAHGAAPQVWKDVAVRSGKGIAMLDRTDIEGWLTVALLVSTRPGAMPPNLARDVEVLASRLESEVAAHPQGRLMIELTDQEVPVAEFLALQATIRQALPVRTLHVCTTCKFEKVVNPDFERLQEKRRRKQAITGALGATISTRGVNPFIVVGPLLRLTDTDNPYVCPRCQGLDADTSIITYCPNCGERRDEAVLRSCQRCKHHFGAAHRAAASQVWQPDLPVAAPPVAIGPPPHPALPPATPAAPPEPAAAPGQGPAHPPTPAGTPTPVPAVPIPNSTAPNLPGTTPIPVSTAPNLPGTTPIPVSAPAASRADPAPFAPAAGAGVHPPPGTPPSWTGNPPVPSPRPGAAAAPPPPTGTPGHPLAAAAPPAPPGPFTASAPPPAHPGAAPPLAGPPPAAPGRRRAAPAPRPSVAVPAPGWDAAGGVRVTDAGGAAAGWRPDPTGRHEQRFWDGSRWTDQVTDRGIPAHDPI